MTLEFDLYYIKTKSYAKFQLDILKHVGEKRKMDGRTDTRRDITILSVDGRIKTDTEGLRDCQIGVFLVSLGVFIAKT